MGKVYERQLLIELETKLEAVQSRLDHMLAEEATAFELQSLEAEWNRLADRVNDLKAELDN